MAQSNMNAFYQNKYNELQLAVPSAIERVLKFV